MRHEKHRGGHIGGRRDETRVWQIFLWFVYVIVDPRILILIVTCGMRGVSWSLTVLNALSRCPQVNFGLLL